MCAWSFQHLSGHEKSETRPIEDVSKEGACMSLVSWLTGKGFRIIGTLGRVHAGSV
jgi:hypothetical protein